MTTTFIDENTLRVVLDGLAGERDKLPSDELRRQADVLLANREGLSSYGPADRARLRVAVEAFCHVNDLQRVLWPAGLGQPYVYRREFPQSPPDVSTPEGSPLPGRTLLGQDIGFPIGVPASVLTSSAKWVQYFAAHGFNVLTYKTVRSRKCAQHPPPNWVFIDDQDEPLPLGTDPRRVVVHGDRDSYLRRLRSFSAANSFGVPSEPPETWQEDVRQALAALDDDKLLILSVMGSSSDGEPAHALRDDFVKVATLAAETGVRAIEMNLSCPNTLDPKLKDEGVKPPLCHDVTSTREVVEAVAEAVRDKVKIVAKLSYMTYDALEPLVEALSPHVDAFSGINTLQVRVEDGLGRPTFDADRHLAGLSGVALRHFAVDFVRSLSLLRHHQSYGYEIIGMGGVMEPVDVHAMLAWGADAVQTATAASTNAAFPRELVEPQLRQPEEDLRNAQEIYRTLRAPDGSFRSPAELADLLGLDRDEVERQLNPLGDLDFPRRVFELEAMRRQGGSPASLTSAGDDLDPQIWGAGPTDEELTEADRLDDELLRQIDQLSAESGSIEEVAAATGRSREEIQCDIDEGRLLWFRRDGRLLIPWWQFADDPSRGRLEGIVDLRRDFGEDLLALSVWVAQPNPHLDGRTPRDALAAGDVEAALEAVGATSASG